MARTAGKGQAKFRVILKSLPNDPNSYLIAPYPLVAESTVRPYRLVEKSQVESIEETGSNWESMGRSFPIVDISIRDDTMVPLRSVLTDMADEKIVEPRTRETIEVATKATQLHGGRGGIYVMGSCESCWCDNVWC